MCSSMALKSGGPDSPHSIIISEKTDFGYFISLDGKLPFFV